MMTIRLAVCGAIALLVAVRTPLALAAPSEGQPSRMSGAHTPDSPCEAIVGRLRRAIPRLMKAADIPGLSIALVHGGDLVWVQGFGVANAETREPVDETTVFEAASLSKPLFAYGVMRLVDSGRLDLDVPLRLYLRQPFLEDTEARSITARHILSHTSGLPNWRPAGEPLRVYFTPGTRFSYSGEGMVYLQRVVEEITGERFEEYMRDAVFDPLGMCDSSYIWQPEYETTKTYAHDLVGDVSGRARPSEANAAGSLHTTAADYGRFVAAMLSRSGLSESAFREMLRSQVAIDPACRDCLATPSGRPSRSLAWGLGWGLEHIGGEEWMWHWGSNVDTKAFAIAGGHLGLGVVLLTNAENGLSILPDILRASVGREHPLLAWIQVERYDAPPRLLFKDIVANGEAAIGRYKRAQSRGGALTEAEVNAIGRALLGKGRYDGALELFELNVADFPGSADAHEGLAESYLHAGRMDLAVRSYRRALELRPRDAAATASLERLSEPEVRVNERLLETYVGRYDTSLGVLAVTREGSRLYSELGKRGRQPLLARSETRFESLAGTVAVSFDASDRGPVTGVALSVEGRTIRGQRTE